MKQMNQRDAIHYIATQQELYSTPIAWYTEGNGWYVVEQKFSSTTSKHQNYVRQAIAEANELVGA